MRRSVKRYSGSHPGLEQHRRGCQSRSRNALGSPFGDRAGGEVPGLGAVPETPAPVVVAVAKLPTPHLPADPAGAGGPDDIDACPDIARPPSNPPSTSPARG